MAPQDSIVAPPNRRRLSFPIRARSSTVAGSLPASMSHQSGPIFRIPLWSACNDSSCGLDVQWKRGTYKEDSGAEDPYDLPVVDVIDHFPEPTPRRRGAKSFSHLRHPVDGLLALGRRVSTSIRRKSVKHTLRPSVDGSQAPCDDGRSHGRGETWNASPNDTQSSPRSSHRRLSFITIAKDLRGRLDHSGATAQVAATVQNESGQHTSNMDKHRVVGNRDSGIEIHVHDQSDASESESPAVRVDPVTVFPSEIMAEILEYLEPDSLMRAGLVSRSWHEEASSRYLWRQVFRRSYGVNPCYGTEANLREKQSVGLGKRTPDQDWKRMFLVRRVLDERWKEGKAAAIYLRGHTDSVYCVQFDENKIITGSRDRTIRIWDAHYPWTCRKVIGQVRETLSSAETVNHRPEQSSGKSPFLTITTPSTPLAEIMTPLDQVADYHTASILCLQYDDEILVTGSSDFTCIVWDIHDDYKPIRRLRAHEAGVLDVCFDDRYIVTCSKDTVICIWDRDSGELVRKHLGHRGPVNAVQLRGDLIVSASSDGLAKLWNVKTGECVRDFIYTNNGLACVEFSDDGSAILIGGNDQVIALFDAKSSNVVKELKGHSGLVRSLYLDSVNSRVISGSYDNSIKVFDVESGEMSIDLPGWTSSWILNVKADYRRIVATSQDASTVIVDFGYGIEGIDLLGED